MSTSLDAVQRALVRPPHRLELPDGGRRAAVAAVVTGDLDLVLVRRAERTGDPWSGHVSFPGGRVEPGESPLDAAIRETAEEISLDLGCARLLGPLDELRTMGPLPPLVIHPYVFAVQELPDLSPNEEVASVHTVHLEDLLTGRGRGTMHHPWKDQQLVLPRVDFDGGRLWGLTLHMVDDLLHRLDGGGRGLERSRLRGQTPWDDRA